MKKKCITNVVTDAGNQGQLPWLATLVIKVTMMVTTMVTTMVTMMVTTMVTTMVTITNLGYRGCVTDYCVSKCVHFAAVILEIDFQFLVYM